MQKLQSSENYFGEIDFCSEFDLGKNNLSFWNNKMSFVLRDSDILILYG
jgi:hypothetical protein